MQSREWSLLCWFKDDRVSTSESWTPLPGYHHQRVVPRDNLTTHTDRFMTSHTDHISISGDSFSLDLVSPASIVFHTLDSIIYITKGVLVRFTIVKSFQTGDIFSVPLHELTILGDDFASL